MTNHYTINIISYNYDYYNNYYNFSSKNLDY